MEKGTKIIFFNSLGVTVVTCFDKDSGKENVMEYFPGAFIECSDKIKIKSLHVLNTFEFDSETLVMYKR